MLLQKYAAGALSTDEKTAFFQAVSDPENKELLEELLADMWEEEPRSDTPSEESLRRISNIMQKARPAVQRRLYWPWAAASVLVLAVSFAVFRYNRPSPPVSRVLLLVAREGEKKQQVLPDGSTVILNAGSSLRYADPFEEAGREVSLNGEAFFEVSKDVSRPFIVKTSHNIRTEVLGTAFNVRDYAAEPEVSISVTEGRIRVMNDDQQLTVLEKSGRLVFDKNTGRHRMHTFDSGKEWNTGFLVFDGDPLSEVLATLGRTYGKQITIDPEVSAGLHVKATFREEQGLDKILALICELHNLQYTKTDHHTIVIRKHK